MAACNSHCLMVLVMVSLFSSATKLEIHGVELATRLKDISENGLGHSKIQKLFNERATFTRRVPTGGLGHAIVRKLAASVGNSFNKYSDAVKKLHHQLMEGLGNLTTTGGNLNIMPCCELKPKDNPESGCYKHPSGSVGPIAHHKDILKTMEENSKAIPNIGWQYVGNEEGLLMLYPADQGSSCTEFDPRRRPWYAEASSSALKDIVIAIESTRHMDTSLIRNAIDILLDTTNPNDRMTVVKFGRDAKSYLGLSDHSTCFSHDLALATPQNSRIFREFINSKEGTGQGPVKLLPVITKAFDYFKKAANETERRKLFVIFIASDPVDAEDPSELIREITAKNGGLQTKVIIQTYAFGSNISDDTKNILQKISKSTTFQTSTGKNQTGTFTHIEHGNQLRLQLHSYYSIFADSNKTTTPIVTVPYFDFSGLGLVMSLCLPLHLDDKLEGVTCVDVELEDIFFNVTYYHQGIDAYAFIIDSRGRAILHPLLPKPTDKWEHPKFINILSLENINGVHEVIESMQSGGNGSRCFPASRMKPWLGVFADFPVSHNFVSEYYWTKVPGTDYSLCMVFTDRDREVEMEPKLDEQQDVKINYIHPYTLLHDDKISKCHHDGQVATTDGSVVMFSGAAYKSLSPGVSPDNSTQRLSYDNYFHGSDYNQAPEFRESTRWWVTLTGLVDTVWKDGTSREYDLQIVWRHLVTASGVIRIYPGTNYTQYDPSSFSWYKQAIISESWLQVHPVVKLKSFNVMIAQAILESSPAAVPVAVVGGEIRPTILYQILEDVYPACRVAMCFIVDGNGYVLAHKLYNNEEDRPSHIMAMETAIAHYLIDNGHLVASLCLDFLSQYRELSNWKMELKGWYVSSMSPRFELHAVHGTNVFVGIAWDNDAKSCNCKNVTKCMKNNQDGCRCPCFKSLKFNLCNNTLPKRANNGPSACSILRNNFDVMQQRPLKSSGISQLVPCFECNKIKAESNCAVANGCQWCMVDGGKEPSCHDRLYCGSGVQQTTWKIGVPITIILLAVIIIIVLCCIIKYSPRLHEKLCIQMNRQVGPIEPNEPVKEVSEDTITISISDSETNADRLEAAYPHANQRPVQQEDPMPSLDDRNLETQEQHEESNPSGPPQSVTSGPIQPETSGTKGNNSFNVLKHYQMFFANKSVQPQPKLQTGMSVAQMRETSGPLQHETSGPQRHETSGPQRHGTSGPQRHETSGPQRHEMSGRLQHETLGPQWHKTSGPQWHETSGPQRHETSGPQWNETSWPQQHETSGPQRHETSGPQWNETSWPQQHETSGPQRHETSGQKGNDSFNVLMHYEMFFANKNAQPQLNTSGLQQHETSEPLHCETSEIIFMNPHADYTSPLYEDGSLTLPSFLGNVCTEGNSQGGADDCADDGADDDQAHSASDNNNNNVETGSIDSGVQSESNTRGSSQTFLKTP